MFCAAVAVGFVLLARWGRRNVEHLVPAGVKEERRAKDVRSIRRGAWSCYLIGALFGVWAVVAAVNLAIGKG